MTPLRQMARIAAIAAGTLTAAALALPLLASLPPTCFYRAATGHLCVFCGMTHALAFVAHGDWVSAQAANPAWLPIIFAFTLTLANPQRRMSWLAVLGCVVATALRW